MRVFGVWSEMASQPQRTLPGPGGGGGGGGGEKRRSFLPAPKRTSGIPTPSSSISIPSSSSIPTPSFSPAPAKPVGRAQRATAEVPQGGPDKAAPPKLPEVIPGAENLAVGQRILIGGVKPGILRFVGCTHIAPGFWCGIELYDASGLHDGEVDGQRYFTCKPFRGIFAPVDKVVPDESPPISPADEKRPPIGEYSKRPENPENSGKASAGSLESGKIPSLSKYQSSRLSGLSRAGPDPQEKAGVRSSSVESSYRSAAFNRRSYGGPEGEAGYYKSRMSSSYGECQDTSRATEEAEGYSSHIKEHLQSDSRRYFNLTFGRDTPPLIPPHHNLPDLLSSVSPPSPEEELAGTGPRQHHQSSHRHSGGPRDLSDIHVGFKEGGEVGMESGVLEGDSVGTGVPSTSESDASLSGQSSTLEDTSVATVNEVVGGKLIPVPSSGENRKVLEAQDRSRSRSPANRQGHGPSDPAVDDNQEAAGHKDRAGRREVKADDGQDGSNEVSPEVSQVLEWDYDHDAFDGKLLEKGQDGMSTSTSESCSESSAGPGAVVPDKAIPELDTPAPQDRETNHEFEENEDGFETIDNIADFPLGMGREGHHVMTDSGISERDFPDSGSEEASKRKAVELDSKVSMVSSPPGGGGVAGERVGSGEDRLQEDLLEGHLKQERPLSLLSTASADTGYVADTDTEEAGTLTANSPMEGNPDRQPLVPGGWTTGPPPPGPRHHVPPPSSSSSPRPKQGRGSPGDPLKGREAGRDLSREVDARRGDRHSQDRPVHDEDSEESEEEEDDEEEEEEEETSEEETTSEEEDDDDDDEEEDSEEESEEEESEDDRVEADRNAPNARNSEILRGANDGRVAAPVVVSSENQAMSGSTVVSNEMTESTDTVRISQKQANDASSEATLPKPQPETSPRPDQTGSSTTASKTGKSAGSGRSSKKPKKKKSSPNSAEDKKIVAEHKKAVKAASSRLADYIKAPPPPPKPKKEKAETKPKKNKDSTGKKPGKAKKKQEAQAAEASQENTEEKKERRQPRVREEKPKVKRTVVKSRWGNIMSQIEASKSTVKIKPKTEIQSSLAAYLSTPAPPNPKREAPDDAEQKEAPKPKPKPKLIKHPKPDFSNVKSKLNITPPVQLPRKDSSPNAGNLKGSASNILKGCNNLKGSSTNKVAASNNLKDSGKPAEAKPRNNAPRKPPVPKFNGKEIVDKRQDSLEKEMGQSQGTGSCASLAGADGNAVSRAGARLRSERASSATSTKSDNSGAQRSVKSVNLGNVQRSEQQSSDELQERKNTVKSSIPPAVARKASTSGSGDGKRVGEGEGGAGTRPTTSSPRPTVPGRPVWGAGSGGGNRKGSVDQTRSRSKGAPGLKSGQPPDVVSTSARDSRAQEVARLESLCEARTKELTLTRLQLKASLQAFDAMACLLGYCTTELDAFSCPQLSAKLKTATSKLTEQQQSLDAVSQQKSQADQQVLEALAAKDAAQQEAARLKEEMRQAEETHSAVQQKLQEEQAAAVKALREEISSQHQETLQQMQKYQENQSEYTRQSHKRQLVELTSEHQMATNQLKVAHLEEIQELRNKHELQVEELHSQHRKKLEDITERFESIKLSLTEKVQSLCTECEDLRVRAKTSEEALQRDADVKVQLALTPYLNLPKEIESLKTVIDMRTEEIQKLRRQNMDLVKQLEELPIVQEKVVALMQKVENLQAIINIKTDHEKQLHEKCQVLMRKYDRESRANKRLSMDYEQVVWRMSQSADFTGSAESMSPRPLSRSPSRGSQHSHGSSPVRSLSSSSQGADSTSANGVLLRQRKPSGGEETDQRRRANTFSADTPRHRRARGDGEGGGVNGPGPGSSGKRRVLSKSGDYSELVSATKEHEESFSSGHESGDTSDFFSSLESNVILETPQGVSFHVVDKTGAGEGGVAGQDEVFAEELILHAIQDVSPEETSSPSEERKTQTEVTVVVTSPSSQ